MPEKPAQSFYRNLAGLDVIASISDRMRREQWYMDPATGKYRANAIALDTDRPWVYTVTDPDMYCGFYLLVFDVGGFVPRRCMKCWKVCAAPRTVDELFKIYALQTEVMVPSKWPCKCGMDLRSYTPHRYGAYWYCQSKDQGLNRYERIRKLIDERISPDLPLILKRYCTEFEMKLGPTDKYQKPADADEIEDAIAAVVNWKDGMISAPQPESVKRHIMRRWIERAYSIGDMSCLAYNNNDPFYPPLVTYHHEVRGGNA
jgi:hypothetical protein